MIKGKSFTIFFSSIIPLLIFLFCAEQINTYESNIPIPTASTTTPIVSINDTIQLQGTANDLYGSIVKWEWDAGNTGTFIETTPDSSYTTLAPSTANSTYPCILRVTDDDGNVAADTVTIDVLLDAPNTTVSTTTPIVSINDTLRYQGTATDAYGNIVKWEWDAGNSGTFVETTPDSSYTAIAPSIADSVYPCVLKVTDNDGNVAVDTVTVNVLIDLPVPSASTTTSIVSINDTLRYQGTATDAYGNIVKWEWDAGNSGTFVETTPDSSFIAIAPSTANSAYPCVLKVTDNDGNSIVDTISVNVLLDAPILTASTTTPTVSINDSIRLQGTATDVYGIIVKWEWKFGDNAWVITSSGDTTIFVPLEVLQVYTCSLRVTDDDENITVDHVEIRVMGTVTDIDGNVYNTIKIGNQVWTVENLRTTKYNDGTAIPNVTDSVAWSSLSTGAYCYYNNDENNKEKYGALYNWHTVNTGKLAPDGWHVPTDTEWYTLYYYLIANGYNWDGTTSDNKIAKSLATKTDWLSSSIAGAVGNDLSSNNSSGFSALPGGYREYDGGFHYFGNYGYWWTNSPCSAVGAYGHFLCYDYTYPYRHYYTRAPGFSVRLVRDLEGKL